MMSMLAQTEALGWDTNSLNGLMKYVRNGTIKQKTTTKKFNLIFKYSFSVTE